MTQTTFTSLIFLVMVAVFMVAWWRGLPHILSMVLAAIAGALAAGEGIPLRHLAEGTFMFFDLVVTILTATVFVGVVRASGAMHGMIADMIRRFHRQPLILLVFMSIVVMIPGALTGSGTAAVLAVGTLVGSVLVSMGIPTARAVSILALGGIIGSFAPPVNIPAMAIANGINMPYAGFFLPLAIISLPLGIGSALWLGARYVRDGLDVDEMLAKLPTDAANIGRLQTYLPFIVVFGLMILMRVFPSIDVGIPVIFMIGVIVTRIVSPHVHILNVSRNMLKEVLPIAGILIGVGVLVQIMTLTGVRGLFVITSITMPVTALYLFIFFGFAIAGALLGSYGSGTVFGIPVMLALLDRDPIIATVGLSLLAAFSSLTPPTAVVGYASSVAMDYRKPYSSILRYVMSPWVVASILGVLIVMFADQLRFLIRY